MPLEVAIIGGGIAGLTLAAALQHNPNLRVNIYERATELKEIGAVIGLAPNALRTLEKIGVADVLTDAVGWRNPNGIPMTFAHYKTGEVISRDFFRNVPDRRHHFARMHRARLQQGLLKHVAPHVIHLGKKVASVAAHRDQGATVTFSDGSTINTDVVIGADGIKSKVRQSFVPNHTLSWTGDVVFRTVFNYSLVEDIPNLPQNSTHFTNGLDFFFATRAGSDQYAVTATFIVDPRTDHQYSETDWNKSASVDTLRERYASWNSLVLAIIDRIPWVRSYTNIAGRVLDQWSFEDRVTLLGDAAHTHGGAFAAGAALAIDDAYALSLAFEEVFPSSGGIVPQKSVPDQLLRVFDLYEAVRKPHSSKLLAIVEAHRRNNLSQLAKRRSGHGETDEEFRKRYTARMDATWLAEHDVEATFRKHVEVGNVAGKGNSATVEEKITTVPGKVIVEITEAEVHVPARATL
ncbi:hypothetical protein A1O3_03791 [Capronia epimyces CBS 606.96]|uniref:FAD-binding domain-containing protein n=1 Tax=Capronia epimyces CBS 606.96 TaxID=1182542 RepID=W9Y237_9EURO|nr:uncharacterized protein A1O3_03791 [Capronia epimyces CBS 606.96]EXJ86837.1 hypothetical protein A1O3_03791 [Capronia epimyces CBS 606.96]